MAQSGTKIAGVRETRKGATIYKTNERPGTRAQVRYVRVSAYKAREVLDLIRGKHVADADEILQFVERDIAIIIRKALASAVANATNNDGQDPEALFVSACYADEGPTLKRWRPRARGRATRIRKRTCHITIIVSRLGEDELAAAAAADPTVSGHLAGLLARASVPTVAAKEWVFGQLTDPAAGHSNHALVELARGLWRSPERALVRPFVGPFLEAIPRMAAWVGDDALTKVVRFGFPFVVEERTIALVDEALTRADLTPGVRRAFVEWSWPVREAVASRRRWFTDD